MEERAGAASSLLTRWLIGVGMFGGGALFLLSFYLAGAAGVPRRYAIEPAPGPHFASMATIGALIFLAGFAICVVEAIRLLRLTRPQYAA